MKWGGWLGSVVGCGLERGVMSLSQEPIPASQHYGRVLVGTIVEIIVNNSTIDNPTVDEATVDEAAVDEATVDEASVRYEALLLSAEGGSGVEGELTGSRGGVEGELTGSWGGGEGGSESRGAADDVDGPPGDAAGGLDDVEAPGEVLSRGGSRGTLLTEGVVVVVIDGWTSLLAHLGLEPGVAVHEVSHDGVQAVGLQPAVFTLGSS